MTSTNALDRPAGTAASDDDELNHYYCCDPNIAHCGTDLTDVPETDFADDDPSLCVVCAYLDNTPCPRGCTDGTAV